MNIQRHKCVTRRTSRDQIHRSQRMTRHRDPAHQNESLCRATTTHFESPENEFEGMDAHSAPTYLDSSNHDFAAGQSHELESEFEPALRIAVRCRNST